MALTLVVNKGNLLVRSIDLQAGQLIGRNPEAAVLLDDPMISRNHARVVEIDGDLFLEDLGSANGLIAEGRLAKHIKLSHGRTIQMPPFTLEVLATSKETSLPPQEIYDMAKALGGQPEYHEVAVPQLLEATPQGITPPRSLHELLGSSLAQPAIETNSRQEPTEVSFVAPPEIQALSSIAAVEPDAPNSTAARTMMVAMEMLPRLHPINFAQPTADLKLQGSLLSIGRAPECDIVLAHPSVTQQHAFLTEQEGRFMLRDNHSSNGTRVNGDLIQEQWLRCHDIIEFGDLSLEYLEGPAQPQARSTNVIEVAEDADFEGVTRKPRMDAAFALLRPFANSQARHVSIGLGLLALLLLSTPLFKRGSRAQQAAQTVNVALNLPQTEQAVLPERERIVQHQLKLARELMQSEKYSEAKVKVDLVLEKLSPNNLEARTLADEIQRVLVMKRQKELERQERSREYKEQISNLMAAAGEATDRQRYEEAKALYRQILGLDADNSVAKVNLQRLQAFISERDSEQARNRAMAGSLAEQFHQGMAAYNAGNFMLAAKYLRPLLQHPEHTKYAQARIAMDDVEEKLQVEIEERLTEARSHYVSGRYVEARQLLQEIMAGDPKHREAIELNSKVLYEAREQAQQLYREGYTFENLVQDFGSAKERYSKVLELLPEKNEEYHQKAQARLRVLN